MENIYKTVAKSIAKFYNSLNPQLKIALMVLSSFLISGFLNLLIRDLTNYNATLTNDYIKLLINGLIPLLTTIINIVQQNAVDAGTKTLALEGDKRTLRVLDKKIKKTEAIKKGL